VVITQIEPIAVLFPVAENDFAADLPEDAQRGR